MSATGKLSPLTRISGLILLLLLYVSAPRARSARWQITSIAVSPLPTQQPDIRTYRLPLNGVLAAAIAPDGLRVAVVISKRTTEPSAGISDYLQVWDVHAQKPVFVGEIKAWPTSSNDTPAANETTFPRSLVYIPEGREIVYCDGTAAHVLDTSDYHEIRTFSLIPITVPRSHWQTRVVRLSPDGKRIAVAALKWGDQGITSGLLLSVYSLTSGATESRHTFEAALDDVDVGLAWSPDGSHLAVALEPNEGHFAGPEVSRDNFSDVRIVGPKGETRIRTRYATSDVAFVGNHELATVSAGPALERSAHDSIRVWNTETGELIRKIPGPSDGAHYVVRVSQNGSVVLSYVGRDRRKENFPQTVQQRFQLWDGTTWRAIALSPPIPIPPHLSYTGDLIRFRLSADGKMILVWWDRAEGAPVYVFESSS